MKRGDKVVCVRVSGPPSWWRGSSVAPLNISGLFNCGLTLDKEYVVEFMEEMPKDFPQQPGLGYRPEFAVVVDDHGYKVAFEQSRFRVI